MQKENNITIVDVNNENEVIAIITREEVILKEGYEAIEDVGIEDKSRKDVKTMNKQSLIYNFKKAKETNSKYVFIVIKLPDTEVPEIIVNRKENFDNKEEYYLKTYDEDLVHNYSRDISIVGLSYGDLDELKNIY